MCNRIYVTDSTDPYENLAAEEYLCRGCGEGMTLFLWQNRDTVVIGRNQNALRECNIAALRRDGVLLARRSTGGGAVFHDGGNLNFSLVFRSESLDKEPGYTLVQGAIEALGIRTWRSGRNDILVEGGRKVSGSAFRHYNGVTLHHGTLLVSSRLERMGTYLNPSLEKLRSHGVDSVPARVANLSDIKPVALTDVKNALAESFCALYGPCSPEKLCVPAEAEAERLRSDDWLYGRDPAAEISLRHRFDWGGLELELKTEKGVLAFVRAYTDAMDPFLSDRLEGLLLGVSLVPGALSEAVSASETEYGASIAAWLASVSL